MAIAFDAVSNSNDYGTSHAWEHIVGEGSNRLLLVSVSIYQTPTVTGITWGEQDLTYLASRARGTSVRVELWYLKNPDSGTKDITVTRSGTSRVICGATSWDGVHQTTTFGSVATTNAYSSAISVNVSSAADEVVIDTFVSRGSVATVGADQTERWNWNGDVGGIALGGGSSSEPGAAMVTMSWSLSASKDWATIGVPLKPVSGEVKELAGTCTISSTVVGTLAVPGGLSNDAELKVLEHIVGKTPFAKPTAYIGFCTANPGEDATGAACHEVPNTNGYARVATDADDWNDASGGAIDNAAALASPCATGSWGEITHYVILDSGTYGEGEVLMYDALDVAVTVDEGDNLEFGAGDLVLELD